MATYYPGDVITIHRPDWGHGAFRPAFIRQLNADGTYWVCCFSSTVPKGPRIQAREGNGLTRDSWVAACTTRRGGVEENTTYCLTDAEIVRFRGELSDAEWALVCEAMDKQLANASRVR